MVKKIKKTILLLNMILLSVNAFAETDLQKHVKYFDEDGDGKISFLESFRGHRKLGLGFGESLVFSGLSSLLLPFKTGDSWLHWFNIDITNIHRAIHGSHTGIYDAQGNFDEAKFKEMFTLFDKNRDNMLSQEEMKAMLLFYKEDAITGAASSGEFNTLMKVAGEDREIDGKFTKVLSRETLRNFYTSNFLKTKADELAVKKAKNSKQHEDL